MEEPRTREPTISTVPANKASWEDLESIFGRRGDPARCQCQWFKLAAREWRATPREARADALREQTRCGSPRATSTSGLVAYLDGEPAGWCAVEPRTAYPRLDGMRVPWAGRDEDKDDDGVWAVTCFVTRVGYRRRGVSAALAAAAVDYARSRGARAIEGYAMITEPGREITWGELYVGNRNVFADAGFAEVSHPSPRRVVMRIDFAAADA
ncbi:GNAT family N-acetyltransferase [Sinomonas mesophila]|uniref:GNAT family N-acetyltransferase n=1 Tax=Sinomonas mesophila TaxID=1531955 RepID=UPI00098780A0|nr:GNAT family N-acetyltransferase [Sinomonas mesophila]